MSQPLLSVIVTCYNVEQYLEKCISSIVNQIYSNLEILLINDGSTDSTETICNEWQKRDARIRVIHKQNEGFIYARKTGIENASAEYVAFVDADDWIDANMYAEMMTVLLSTNSDLVQCDYCTVYEDGRIERCGNEQKSGTVDVIGRTEGVLMFLERKMPPYVWNKICKKQLYMDVNYYKGRRYGEGFINIKLFHNASQSAYLNRAYYYYYQRNGSLVHATNIGLELKNLADFSDDYFERHDFTKSYPQYQPALPHVAIYALRLTLQLLRNIIESPQYFSKDYFDTKVKQVRSISLYRQRKLQTGLKIEYYLIKISPRLYKIFRLFYAGIIKMTNKLKITNKKTCYILSELWECLSQ